MYIKRTCFSARSRHVQRVNWLIADLLIEYARRFGNDRIPQTLDTFTMLPLVFTICGIANIVKL